MTRRPRRSPLFPYPPLFRSRGLTPPHCTPEALAQALERERQIIITFHPHASDDPGVYGLLYRQEGAPPHYMIVFRDRKSTRLNSSHSQISYAVFCLKKKKTH